MADGGDAEVARGQLELFGTLLSSLVETRSDDAPRTGRDIHAVLTKEGQRLTGSWEEIVRFMRDADMEGLQDRTPNQFMARVSKRAFRETGVRVPHHDAELFVRASADAGLLRIVQ